MDYEQKYKEALEKARQFSEHPLQEDSSSIVEYIFPELAESEDEKIRKWLIDWAKAVNWSKQFTVTKEQVLAWLEKQKSVGEIVERCKKSWYNEGKIRGQIEGLTDDEKYQQGWHDALEKQEGQKSSVWSGEDEKRLKSCLNILQPKTLLGSTETINTKWLKSLKQRITEKQEPIAVNWSTDDKNKLLIIEQILNCAGLLINSQELTEIKNWLKSLKQRIGG